MILNICQVSEISPSLRYSYLFLTYPLLEGAKPRDPNSDALKNKNASATGAVLMIDANQVWDVKEAIDYVKGLAEIKPW